MAEDKTLHREPSSLVSDILSLLRARESALVSELAQLREYRHTFDPSAPSLTAASAPDAPPSTRSSGRRKFTPAQRRAASKRMKAVWSARKAKG